MRLSKVIDLIYWLRIECHTKIGYFRVVHKNVGEERSS